MDFRLPFLLLLVGFKEVFHLIQPEFPVQLDGLLIRLLVVGPFRVAVNEMKLERVLVGFSVVLTVLVLSYSVRRRGL